VCRGQWHYTTLLLRSSECQLMELFHLEKFETENHEFCVIRFWGHHPASPSPLLAVAETQCFMCLTLHLLLLCSCVASGESFLPPCFYLPRIVLWPWVGLGVESNGSSSIFLIVSTPFLLRNFFSACFTWQ
jgi:hypothetical protein